MAMNDLQRITEQEALVIIEDELGEEGQYPYDLSEHRSDNYICDCEKSCGKDCLFPEKYRKEGCN